MKYLKSFKEASDDILKIESFIIEDYLLRIKENGFNVNMTIMDSTDLKIIVDDIFKNTKENGKNIISVCMYNFGDFGLEWDPYVDENIKCTDISIFNDRVRKMDMVTNELVSFENRMRDRYGDSICSIESFITKDSETGYLTNISIEILIKFNKRIRLLDESGNDYDPMAA